MNTTNNTIGISAIGRYIPEGKITIEEIAAQSGIPVNDLINKIGMLEKRIAKPDETPTFMGMQATQMALAQAGVSAKEIDVIIYAAAGVYDYNIWSPAAKVQGMIGAQNATCFEVKNGCCAGNLALHLCKTWLLANNKNHGLVVCAEGLSQLINYKNQDSAAFFMVGDGASATVLSRNEKQNKILSYAAYTDGTLADYIKIPGGGTLQYPADKNNCFFQFTDPIKLAHIFENTYLKHYVDVISKALNESGLSVQDINHLFNNQVKQSTSDAILSALGLSKAQTTTSLAHFGHMGAADVFYGLYTAQEKNHIKKGDVVVLASSGTGFTWAAQVIQF